jgi:hypothetical protein
MGKNDMDDDFDRLAGTTDDEWDALDLIRSPIGDGAAKASRNGKKPGAAKPQRAPRKHEAAAAPVTEKPKAAQAGKREAKPAEKPVKLVWHLVGGVDQSVYVPAPMAQMIIFVLAQSADYYLQALPTPKFKEVLSAGLGQYTDLMAARLKTAISGGRVVCDKDGWAAWDKLIRKHLDPDWRKGMPPRGFAFHADLAAREAESVGVKILWSLSSPDRMRIVGPEKPAASKKDGEARTRPRKKRKLHEAFAQDEETRYGWFGEGGDNFDDRADFEDAADEEE